MYRNFVDGSFTREVGPKNLPMFLPSKSYVPEFTMNCPELTECITFFSKFENANLQRAYKVSRTEYELYLSEDFNTSGHYHWFYFKTTSNLPANTKVTFKILNMTKPGNLYTAGFKPFAYSIKEATGWIQAGDCVSYTPIDSSESHKKYYTLSWEYTYKFPNDEVYFAQFIPYTYSDLLNDIKKIKEAKDIVRIDMLCKTVARNVCPMLTITEDVEAYISYKCERKISTMSKSTKKILYNRLSKLQNKLKSCHLHKKNKNGEQSEALEAESNKRDNKGSVDDLETALLRHNEVHHNKKGIIIVARVHPGKKTIN